MIVKDKSATIERASNLSIELMKYVGKRCAEVFSENDDDPAEHIYMLTHSIACLCTRVALTLEKYGKIYGIEKMTAENIAMWISEIASEHISYNRKPIDAES